MPNLNLSLTDEQVVTLVKQLSPERQRQVLMALAAGAVANRRARQQDIQEKMRQLAADRGLEWDSMSEEDRLDFVDDLVHEDRGCA